MKTRRSVRFEVAAQTSSVKPGAEGSDEVTLKVGKGECSTHCKETQPDFITLNDEPCHVVTLASELEVGPLPGLYFSCDTDEMVDRLMAPRTKVRTQVVTGRGCRGESGSSQETIMKKSVVTSDFERKDCAPPISQSRYAIKKLKRAAAATSTGEKWFNMSAPQLTSQLKNDLLLLKMRNSLDPSRHYKANDSKKIPQYFQVGRVVTGSADFYSSRIPRRRQKQSLVDELLFDEEFRRYHHKKYAELQKKFRSGTGRKKSMPFKKKFFKK